MKECVDRKGVTIGWNESGKRVWIVVWDQHQIEAGDRPLFKLTERLTKWICQAVKEAYAPSVGRAVRSSTFVDSAWSTDYLHVRRLAPQ